MDEGKPYPARALSLDDAAGAFGKPLCLAIGMFDGVHLGHQEVIRHAQEMATEHSGTPGVLTFDPHPSRLFRPEEPTLLILSLPLRAAFLRAAGAETVLVQDFNTAFSKIEAEAFPAFLKQRLPSLAGVVVGENFRFGRRRRGDPKLLRDLCDSLDLRLSVVPRLPLLETAVSSTRIRACLIDGEIALANRMLGRPYSAHGRVQAGRQLGRTIGFPTLNLPWEPELQPARGVYAVRLVPHEDEAISLSAEGHTNGLPGVANYGVRPTVTDAEARPVLETHLLTPVDWGPGTPITVEWHRFLRPEQRFPSVDALREQIRRDLAQAREFWER